MDKIAVLRHAAGDRWDELEIGILIFDVTVTTDRRSAAAAYLDDLSERLGQFTIGGEQPITACGRAGQSPICHERSSRAVIAAEGAWMDQVRSLCRRLPRFGQGE